MQTFSFIFFLVLMALILGYGIRSFMSVKTISDDVGLGDFVFHLRDEVDALFSFEVGSSKHVTFLLAPAVERVCFYNGDEPITTSPLDPTLKLHLEANPDDNIFVMPFTFAQNTFSLEHLRAGQENPLCFLTKGKLQSRLETVLGDDGTVYVEIQRIA